MKTEQEWAIEFGFMGDPKTMGQIRAIQRDAVLAGDMDEVRRRCDLMREQREDMNREGEDDA